MRRARIAIAAALLFASSGCFKAQYLAQAGGGEMKMLCAARPIPKVLADPATPPRIHDLLARVPEIKRFGIAQGLTATKNYDRYADLHRDAAVWVVEACAPLAFSPKRWHFPIAGTVPYLGFFHRKSANDYAACLAKHGDLDVDVRTAGAFSTLGWFKDPVLSTMIPEGDEALGELANVVLHESTHATLYVKDQSAFDESLASFVADHLTPIWLAQTLGPDAKELAAWNAAQERYRAYVTRMHQAHDDLDAVYRSSASDDEKRAKKAEILAALTSDLHLTRPVNNATLMDFATYDTGGPAFASLLAACGNDVPRFFAALRQIHFPNPQDSDFAPLVQTAAATCH